MDRCRPRRRRRRPIGHLRGYAKEPDNGGNTHRGCDSASEQATLSAGARSAKADHFFPWYSASVTGMPQVIVPP